MTTPTPDRNLGTKFSMLKHKAKIEALEAAKARAREEGITRSGVVLRCAEILWNDAADPSSQLAAGRLGLEIQGLLKPSGFDAFMQVREPVNAAIATLFQRHGFSIEGIRDELAQLFDENLKLALPPAPGGAMDVQAESSPSAGVQTPTPIPPQQRRCPE